MATVPRIIQPKPVPAPVSLYTQEQMIDFGWIYAGPTVPGFVPRTPDPRIPIGPDPRLSPPVPVPRVFAETGDQS